MATSRGGRSLDAQAGQTILDATTQLLIEVGFARLRIDAVAARAGVSKATIYRRWRSKSALLYDTLAQLDEAVTVVDTGDLGGDLRALMHGAVEEFVVSDAARLMPQLSAEAQVDPDVRDLLHAYARTRRAAAHEIFARAAARGDLRDGVDIDVAVDMLTAPIFVRKLITGAPIDTDVIDAAIEILLRGLTVER